MSRDSIYIYRDIYLLISSSRSVPNISKHLQSGLCLKIKLLYEKKPRLHNKKCGRKTYFEIFVDMKHNNLCSSKDLDISDYHFDTCWV